MKWLTAAGAAAALVVGGATIWGTGWRGLLLLLAFFISGSLMTPAAKDGGGRRRTAYQVLANGGVAAAAALLGSWPAFAGSIAAAAADTWATEIGAHSRTPPRLITTWARVPPGQNGGVTLLGTAGGVLGALFIAALTPGGLKVTVAIAGVSGMLIDSVLGATLQGPKDRWMNNDAVNLAMTAAAAGIAAWIA